jgi:hypothetical protein
MMGFNIFLNRDEIREKYSVPRELEEEVFAILRPVSGSGVNARYLESVVDRQLHNYFAARVRPNPVSSWSFGTQEDQDMTRDGSSWASTVEKEDRPAITVPEPLLVDEETAGQLLGVSRRTVFDLEKNGLLQSKWIGSRKLYAVSHLRDFAEGKVA